MALLTRDELEHRILLEEGGLLAVNKCPDLPTTGRALDDPDCLQWHLIERRGAMVWSVHQLDADTSGVCMFTTEKRLVEPLKQAMSGPGGAKVYRAFARGLPEWNQTLLGAPIGFSSPGQLGVTADGRSASTQFTVAARFAAHSSAELRGQGACELFVQIHTGRTHQIRIHAGHLGHPLLGEEWYRNPPCTAHPRQALHAESLRLGPPFDKQLMAPLPADLVALKARLSQG